MSHSPNRLPYDHSKFVDRKKEVQWVQDKIECLIDGEPLNRRTIIFHGQRGAGKSWLLQEVMYQNEKKGGMLIFYLDLATFAEQQPGKAVRLAIKRLHQMVAQIVGPAAAGFQAANSLDQQTDWLVADAEQLSAILVLLLDHVNESEEDLLEILEDRLLAPLINLPKTLLVMAGRGKQYVWKSPELRIRSDEWDLAPFKLPDTQAQIEKQVPRPSLPVDEIQRVCGGYPGSNYTLAQGSDDPVTALENCVLELIDDWLTVPQPPAQREHLEALCVLRAFSEAMIPHILAAYFEDPAYLDWKHRQCRQVRQSLVSTTLVKWDEPSGGYAIDDALRRILCNWLYEAHLDAWTRLHTAARDLFTEWIKEYPRTAERWREASAYHAEKLAHGPGGSVQD